MTGTSPPGHPNSALGGIPSLSAEAGSEAAEVGAPTEAAGVSPAADQAGTLRGRTVASGACVALAAGGSEVGGRAISPCSRRRSRRTSATRERIEPETREMP